GGHMGAVGRRVDGRVGDNDPLFDVAIPVLDVEDELLPRPTGLRCVGVERHGGAEVGLLELLGVDTQPALCVPQVAAVLLPAGGGLPLLAGGVDGRGDHDEEQVARLGPVGRVGQVEVHGPCAACRCVGGGSVDDV